MADSWGTAANDGAGWGDSWGASDGAGADQVASWDEGMVASIQQQYDISTYSTLKRNQQQQTQLGWGADSQELPSPLNGATELGYGASNSYQAAPPGSAGVQSPYNPLRAADPHPMQVQEEEEGVPLSAARLPHHHHHEGRARMNERKRAGEGAHLPSSPD